MTWTIALVIPIIFSVLATFLPYKKNDFSYDKDFETLKREYDKWEKMSIIPILIITPLLGYLLGQMFFFLFETLSNQHNNLLYFIVPEKSSWYIPGGIISFSLIGYIMEYTYKLFLKRRYYEYLHYTNLKHGFDGEKLMKPITWLIAIFGMIYIVGLSDYSISINKDKIELDKLIGLSSQTLHINQIKSIQHFEGKVFDDKFTKNSYYIIEFKDGITLDTSSDFPSKMQQDDIVKYLSKRTNLSVISKKNK